MKFVWMIPLALMLVVPGNLAAQGPEVGGEAPPFELEDSKGKLYRLSDYRGEKHVVLEFFRGAW